MKKELTKSQTYAVSAANTKMIAARMEFQNVVNNIADELGVNSKNEKWGLSADMQHLERRDVPPIVKETFPSGDSKTKRKKGKG